MGEEQQTDDPGVFEKGVRVRIADGEAEGTVGEIVWWGRSKFGHQMRAGVQPEEEDADAVWVDAPTLVAIDNDGNDLDPQPKISRPAAAPGKRTRAITVPPDLGTVIAAIRVQRGYPTSKASTATVRLDRLQEAEEALGCRIPDPIIGYVVSALGEVSEPGGIVGLTLDLADRKGDETPVDELADLAFDYDNGDFLSFGRGDGRDATSFVWHLHEESHEAGPSADLNEWLRDRLESRVPAGTEPFEVVVDYITVDEPEPEEPAEQWATHPKFGRGRVVDIEPSSKGDKLTIEFEDDQTRKLLARFVELE